MPPCRRYSRSRGVSRRTRAVNVVSSARTVTSRASAFSTPSIAKLSRPVRPRLDGDLPVAELERQDAHHQQVRAMDPLVALGDHGLHAEQVRPLRGPVAGRARPVLLSRDHDQRRPLREVALRDLEDRPLLARREMHRPRALRARHEQVAQPHVREGAANHHLVVAAPRAVRVEVLALDPVLDQVAAGRAVGLDRAGGRDVVGGDGVAEHDEAARAGDVLDRPGLRRHAVEVRRQADVRRALVPGEQLALRDGQRPPLVVAGEHVGVRRAEHLVRDRAGHRLLHLGRGRPDVVQEDVVAVVALAQRLVHEIDVHPPGERVGDDERWRREVVRLHLGMDARLEVAVAREHRADDEVALGDGVRDRLRAAAPSCRCRSCSRSRRCGSRAPRGTASARPCRSTRSRPSSRARGST